MKILLKPDKIITLLISIIAVLLFFHLCGLFSIYYLGHPRACGLVRLFHLDREYSIPTFFSALLHLLSATLLFVIAIKKKRASDRSAKYWSALGYIFLFLSLDEACAIHEQLILPLRNAIGASGLIWYTWVIPYGVVVIALAIIYLRFVTKLPTRIRGLFIASGIIFVSGAVGFEMLSARQHYLYGKQTALFEVYSGTEELFEMLAITLFIYTLLSYINNHLEEASLTIQLHPKKL